MSINFKTVVTSLTLALTSQLASAASYSFASLSPITITLFDLNPADSINPSISWDSDYYNHNTYVLAYANDSENGQYLGKYQIGNTFGGDNSLSFSAPQSMASASISDGTSLNSVEGLTLTAQGASNGISSFGNYANYNATANAPYTSYFNFTLSAYTSVMFTATAYTSANTTVGYQPNWGDEYASAYASMIVSGPPPSGSNGSQSSSTNSSSSAGYSYNYIWNNTTQTFDLVYSGQSMSTSELLGVSFVNLSNTAKQGLFAATTSVIGNSFVNATQVVTNVPEPDSYSLILTGLGLLGFASRHKRNQT